MGYNRHKGNVMEGTRLTGLWKNKSKAGETYLSGTVGLAKVLVMPNAFKREGKADPDFYLLLVPNEKKDAPKAATTAADDDLGF